jgi:hypothetical protein
MKGTNSPTSFLLREDGPHKKGRYLRKINLMEFDDKVTDTNVMGW